LIGDHCDDQQKEKPDWQGTVRFLCQRVLEVTAVKTCGALALYAETAGFPADRLHRASVALKFEDGFGEIDQKYDANHCRYDHHCDGHCGSSSI
jgi:hypothetical protein